MARVRTGSGRPSGSGAAGLLPRRERLYVAADVMSRQRPPLPARGSRRGASKIPSPRGSTGTSASARSHSRGAEYGSPPVTTSAAVEGRMSGVLESRLRALAEGLRVCRGQTAWQGGLRRRRSRTRLRPSPSSSRRSSCGGAGRWPSWLAAFAEAARRPRPAAEANSRSAASDPCPSWRAGLASSCPGRP